MDNIFYMYSNMDSSSQILIFLIILVGLMLVSILIINHITKKRNEKYNNRFHRVDKYSNYSKNKQVKRSIMNVEKPTLKEEKYETIKLKEEPKIITFEKKKEEPKVVNKVITFEEKHEEPEVIEIISEDSSIDKISDLIEDNINNPKPIDLTKYEEEEEKNAIISYDELVKAAGAKKIVYKTDEEVEKIAKASQVVKKVEEPKGKFRASQIISPIYGIQKEKKEEKEELEEFIEIEDIPINNATSLTDDEMQKDITFLTNLKTFRSKLD